MADQLRRDNSIKVGEREVSKKKADLMPASEWDYGTISQLSKALRARKISASELLEDTIARIETVDQHLNAVVVRDFVGARRAAAAADIALARGERRPLLGIPMTIKEAFNIAGLRSWSRG
jgi:amidase